MEPIQNLTPEALEQQKQSVSASHHTLPQLVQVSKRFENVSSLGVVADNSACGHYRVILPYYFLAMHGARVATTAGGAGLGDFWKFDHINFPRQSNKEILEAARYAQWDGKTCSYEIDDDLSHVLPSSPAFSTYHTGSPENRMVPKFISHMHGFTTTTRELAKWYYQFNRNAKVVENFIDLSTRDWNYDVSYEGGYPIIKPLPPRRLAGLEDKIVIGYQGGSTHWEDLESSGLGGSLKYILEKHDNVVFAMYADIRMLEAFVARYNLPKDKVFHIPARHFMDHPSGMHGIDIGLAPILACQFNLGKSHLKFLEGMAAGTAMIGSNVGPYARFERRHPGTVLTVGQGKWSSPTWVAAIEKLILNPDLLHKMKIEGRQLIVDQYSMEKNIHLWPSAWFSIVEACNNGICGLPEERKKSSDYASYGITGANDRCPCGSGLKYKACCKGAWG